jgi:hypothetical protein
MEANVVPPNAVLLAKADSDTGLVVPTLDGVREAVTQAFAQDIRVEDAVGGAHHELRAWELGAGIRAELQRVEHANDVHAAESLKAWVGRTLRTVIGWNDPNSPEKDVPGLLAQLNAEQRDALIQLGEYAMYRSRRHAVQQQLQQRALGESADVLDEYPPPPADRPPEHSQMHITGDRNGLEDVLVELRGSGTLPQRGAPGVLECINAGGLIWERAS